MEYRCFELCGCTYLPKCSFSAGNLFVIPTTPHSPPDSPVVIDVPQMKLIVCSKLKDLQSAVDETSKFAFFYQLLFFGSWVYKLLAAKLLNSYEGFIVECSGEAELESIIRKSAHPPSLALLEGFPLIKGNICQLDREVDFINFYNKFTNAFEQKKDFREQVRLFLHICGEVDPFYGNRFQQILGLRAILEKLLGAPSEVKCCWCKRSHPTESTNEYWEKKLTKEFEIPSEDASLIIELDKAMRSPRNKFGHSCKYFHESELFWQEIVDRNTSSEEQNLTVQEVIKKPTRDWTSLNWTNVYNAYKGVARHLIIRFYDTSLS